jgi:hypothetical protein
MCFGPHITVDTRTWNQMELHCVQTGSACSLRHMYVVLSTIGLPKKRCAPMHIAIAWGAVTSHLLAPCLPIWVVAEIYSCALQNEQVGLLTSSHSTSCSVLLP